jgi:hypothetical protein
VSLLRSRPLIRPVRRRPARLTRWQGNPARCPRRWTLTSPVKSITSAGLYVVGDTVWAWTDWATDESGFQYAEISRIHTTSAAVRVVDKSAFPGDMAADAAGPYVETVHGMSDGLAHASPTTPAVEYRQGPVDAPLALAGGRVDLLVFGISAEAVYSYNANTLAPVSTKRTREADDGIAGAAVGLLVLAQPCDGFPCSSATVGRLNVATGGTTGALSTPGAYQLLNGPAQAVIEASGVSGTHAHVPSPVAHRVAPTLQGQGPGRLTHGASRWPVFLRIAKSEQGAGVGAKLPDSFAVRK